MKGYMGDTRQTEDHTDADGFEHTDDVDTDDDVEDGYPERSVSSGDQGFDLIYVLDSIYHFPPAVPHFLTTAISSLSSGGVIVYTDVLPPSDLSSLVGHWVLPTIVGVPARNLVQRPNTLEAYREQLLKIGYAEVDIEDWTMDVFPGFAKFLRSRGGSWPVVARGVEWAQNSGWRNIAVRAKKA